MLCGCCCRSGDRGAACPFDYQPHPGETGKTPSSPPHPASPPPARAACGHRTAPRASPHPLPRFAPTTASRTPIAVTVTGINPTEISVCVSAKTSARHCATSTSTAGAGKARLQHPHSNGASSSSDPHPPLLLAHYHYVPLVAFSIRALPLPPLRPFNRSLRRPLRKIRSQLERHWSSSM